MQSGSQRKPAALLSISEGADFAGFAFPDQRGFVLAPGPHVAVEAVAGQIELAADKLFRPGICPAAFYLQATWSSAVWAQSKTRSINVPLRMWRTAAALL